MEIMPEQAIRVIAPIIAVSMWMMTATNVVSPPFLGVNDTKMELSNDMDLSIWNPDSILEGLGSPK